MSDKGFEELYRIIFEVLEKNNRIERMVQELSEKLDISIWLVDSYGRIMAKESAQAHKEKRKPACDEGKAWVLLMEEYYDSEHVQEYVVNYEESGCQVLHPIKVKDNIEGFCITYHDDWQQETEAIEINKLIARMVAVRFKLSGMTGHLDESAAKQIISRVLLGDADEEASLPKLNKKQYDAYIIEPFVLAVIEPKVGKPAYEQQFRQKICGNFENSLTYIEGHKLWVLFMNVNLQEKREEIERYLKNIAESTVIALSDKFECVKEIQTKKKVLQRIIRIGTQMDKEECLFKEYDYYLELICSYAYDEIGYQGYCNKELEDLEKEDAEKGTEFYKSLKEYLLCGNNVNLAAKKIFVHRNTMVYRLAKIHELMQVDINDPEVAKKLLMSIILRSLRP